MVRNDPYEPLYRVVEDILGQGLQTEIVASQHGREPMSYNKRNRIYPRLQEARTYVARLAKEGRRARILKFVYQEEV